MPRGAEVSARRSRHGGGIGSSASTSASSSRISQPLLAPLPISATSEGHAVGRQGHNGTAPVSGNLNSNSSRGLLGETNSRSGTLLFPRSATPVERFYQPALSGVQRSSTSVSTSGSSRLRNNSIKPKPRDLIQAQAATTSRLAERAITGLPAPDASLQLYRPPLPWSALHDAVSQFKSEEANRAWMASSGGTSGSRKSEVGVLNISKMERAKRDMEEMILETTRAKRRKVGHGLGDRDAPFVFDDFTKASTPSASRNPFRRRTVSDPPIPPSASVAESMEPEPDFSRLGQEDSEDEIQNGDFFDPLPIHAADAKSKKTAQASTASSTPSFSKSKPKPQELEETPSSNISQSSTEKVKKLIPILSLEPPIFSKEVLRISAENERKALGLPVSDNAGKKKVVKSKNSSATVAAARRKSTGSSMTTSSKTNPFDWKSWGKST